MCIFNSDNVAIQNELLRPTSITVQDHITFRLHYSLDFMKQPANMQNMSLTENAGIEI